MIIIYGSADDLVVVEGCPGAGAFFAPAGRPDQIAWRGDLVGPDGDQLRVHLFYDGCWHAGIGQVRPYVPLPPWSVRLTSGGAPVTNGQTRTARLNPGHSGALLIDAPAATRLTNIRSLPARASGSSRVPRGTNGRPEP